MTLTIHSHVKVLPHQTHVMESFQLTKLSIDRLEEWCKFCQISFSEKSNPPTKEYFLNHFNNDPKSDVDLIFIALNENNEIIGTVRLFDREIYQFNSISRSNSKIRLAGIGEVCTKREYRRLGLSRKLLSHALTQAESLGYQYSFLHAAPWIQALYHENGFRSTLITTIQTKLPVDLLRATTSSSNVMSSLSCQCHSIDVNDYVLDILHFNHSFQSKFNGALVTEEDYVRKWLRCEASKGLVFGLLRNDKTVDNIEDEIKSNLIGYAIIQPRGNNTFRVADVGLSEYKEDSQKPTVAQQFWLLVISVLQSILIELSIQNNDYLEYFNLTVPLPILQSINAINDNFVSVELPRGSSCDKTLTQLETDKEIIQLTYESSVDNGWMVCKLGSRVSDDEVSMDLFFPIHSF